MNANYRLAYLTQCLGEGGCGECQLSDSRGVYFSGEPCVKSS